jgi:hypothetical protein
VEAKQTLSYLHAAGLLGNRGQSGRLRREIRTDRGQQQRERQSDSMDGDFHLQAPALGIAGTRPAAYHPPE